MTDANVIAKLGGGSHLARCLSVPRSTVANWNERGIPWKHRATIAEMAAAAGVSVPADFCKRRAW